MISALNEQQRKARGKLFRLLRGLDDPELKNADRYEVDSARLLACEHGMNALPEPVMADLFIRLKIKAEKKIQENPGLLTPELRSSLKGLVRETSLSLKEITALAPSVKAGFIAEDMGIAIRNLRMLAGISKSELGAKVGGLSEAEILFYEKGRVRPPQPLLQRFLTVFQCDSIQQMMEKSDLSKHGTFREDMPAYEDMAHAELILRKAQGLSQRKVAGKLKLTGTTIGHFEKLSDKKRLHVSYLEMMPRIFGFSTCWEMVEGAKAMEPLEAKGPPQSFTGLILEERQDDTNNRLR